MRNYQPLILYVLIWGIVPWASPVLSQNIQADLRIFVFETPEGNSFVEVYTGLLSNSLTRNETDHMRGVEVTTLINKDSAVVLADRYRLSSTDSSSHDFYHIERYQLSDGDYNFQVNMVDLVDTTRQFHRVLSARVSASQSVPTFSDIQVLANVSKANASNRSAKSGLIMEPLKFKYLNANYDKFYVYLESYRMNEFTDINHYLLRYDFIHETAAGRDTVLTRYKRRDAAAVDPILITEINDTAWSSGNYNLVFLAMDYEQNILASATTDLIISNPRANRKVMDELPNITFVDSLEEDQVLYALRALAPKVHPQDVERLNYLIAHGEMDAKKSFLFRFWVFFNPLDPKQGYDDYMKVVRAVDNLYYDGLGRGFETDRGYIYLKYGQPDHTISIEDEPTAPPYEIWTYTEFPATRQNNVKFVFYNPASTTYELLHSNARGEVNDPQWLIKLYRNSPEDVIGNTIDAREVKDYWNRRAADYFNDN